MIEATPWLEAFLNVISAMLDMPASLMFVGPNAQDVMTSHRYVSRLVSLFRSESLTNRWFIACTWDIRKEPILILDGINARSRLFAKQSTFIVSTARLLTVSSPYLLSRGTVLTFFSRP